MGKDQDAGDKGNGRKAIGKTIAITAAVILAGVGGYAYASNSAYDSYESRVESDKESDSKLVKKIAEAQSLVKATKESDVLDKAVLDSLNKSLKVGESRKGVPTSSHAAKWNLWSVSKAKTIVSNDMTEANDSINAIGQDRMREIANGIEDNLMGHEPTVEELNEQIADMEKRLAKLKAQRDALIHQNK